MKLKRMTALLLALLLALGALPGALAARSDAAASDDYCPESGNGKHAWSDWDPLDQPSCTQKGYGVRVCQYCGYAQYGDIPKLSHSYGSWKVTKEATCTSEGQRQRKCSVCGHVDKDAIDRLPHSWGEWTVTLEPTDFSMGTRTHTCQVCGTERAEDFYPEGTLKRGDRGDGVKALQQALNDRGYDCGAVDGAFGGRTETAVKGFEAANGIEADGIAWPGVLAMLAPVTPTGPVVRTPPKPGSGLVLTVEPASPLKEAYQIGETIDIKWTLTNNTAQALNVTAVDVTSSVDTEFGLNLLEDDVALAPGQTIGDDSVLDISADWTMDGAYTVTLQAFATIVGTIDPVNSNAVPLSVNLVSGGGAVIVILEPQTYMAADDFAPGYELKYDVRMHNVGVVDLMGGRIEMRVNGHVMDGGLVPAFAVDEYSEVVTCTYEIDAADVERGYIDLNFRGIGYMESGPDAQNEVAFTLYGPDQPQESSLMLYADAPLAPRRFKAGVAVEVPMTLENMSEGPLTLTGIEGETWDTVYGEAWMDADLAPESKNGFKYALRIQPEEAGEDYAIRQVQAWAVDPVTGDRAHDSETLVLANQKKGPSLLVVPLAPADLTCAPFQCVDTKALVINNGDVDLTITDFGISACGGNLDAPDEYTLTLGDDMSLKAGESFYVLERVMCSEDDVEEAEYPDNDGMFSRMLSVWAETPEGKELQVGEYFYVHLAEPMDEDIGDMPDIPASLTLIGTPLTKGVYKQGETYSVALAAYNAGPDALSDVTITVDVEGTNGDFLGTRSVYAPASGEITEGGRTLNTVYDFEVPDIAAAGHGLVLTFEAEGQWWYAEEETWIPVTAWWTDVISDGTIARLPDFELVVTPVEFKDRYHVGEKLHVILELINRDEIEFIISRIQGILGGRGGWRTDLLVPAGQRRRLNLTYEIRPEDIVDGTLTIDLLGKGSAEGLGDIHLRNNPVVLNVQGPSLVLATDDVPAAARKAGEEFAVHARAIVNGDEPLKLNGIVCNEGDRVEHEAWMDETLQPGKTYEMTYIVVLKEDVTDWDHRYLTLKAQGVESGEPVEAIATIVFTGYHDEASLKLVVGDPSGLVGREGELVPLDAWVINDGSQTLKDIELSSVIAYNGLEQDDAFILEDASLLSGLAPGQQLNMTLMTEVTFVDAEHGAVHRDVSVRAVGAESGAPVSDAFSVAFVAEPPEEELGDGVPPELELIVDQKNDGDAFTVGESAEYALRLINNTDQTLTYALIWPKDGQGQSREPYAVSTLEPWHSESFDDEYTFTAEDAQAGSITLRWEGRAMDEDGERIDAEAVEMSYTVTGGEDPGDGLPPSASVTKAAVGTSADPNGYAPGEDIHYVITVTNDGGEPLSEVAVYDPLHGSSEDMLLTILMDMEPGESRDVAMDYTVTAADAARGYVSNQATIQWVDGELSPTAQSNVVAVPCVGPAGGEIPEEGGTGMIAIVKEVLGDPGDPAGYALGEKIRYRVTLTNGLDIALDNFGAVDYLNGINPGTILEGLPEVLGPGESFALEYDHEVTQADLDRGHVENKACFWALLPDGELNAESQVVDVDCLPDGTGAKPDKPAQGGKSGAAVPEPKPNKPEDPEGIDEPAQAEAPAEGETDEPGGAEAAEKGGQPTSEAVGILVEKWAANSPANGACYVAGEAIAYGIRVTNLGEAAVDDIAVIDALAAENGGQIALIGHLVPNHFREYEFEYRVTEEDAANGSVVNTARAQWQLPEGGDGAAESDPVEVPTGDDTVPGGLTEPILAGEGCLRAITGLGAHTVDSVQQYCPEHQAVADAVKALIDDAGADHAKKLAAWQQAEVLWTEAVNAQYDLLAEGVGEAAARLVNADRAAYFAWLEEERKALEARLPDDAEQVAMRVSEQLMNQCAELCQLLHTAPGDRADSLVTGAYETLEDEDAPGGNCRREAAATDTGAQVFEYLCGEHAAIEAQARPLILAGDTAQAQALWLDALEAALADDPQAKAAQEAWLSWLDARAALLYWMHPDGEALAGEIVTGIVRARAVDLCAPQTKSVRLRRDKAARITGVSTQRKP